MRARARARTRARARVCVLASVSENGGRQIFVDFLIPPRWPCGKGACFESGRPRLDSCFHHGAFTGSSYSRVFKKKKEGGGGEGGGGTPVLPYKAPANIGSALGLAGLVSVYCDRVK